MPLATLAESLSRSLKLTTSRTYSSLTPRPPRARRTMLTPRPPRPYPYLGLRFLTTRFWLNHAGCVCAHNVLHSVQELVNPQKARIYWQIVPFVLHGFFLDEGLQLGIQVALVGDD